MQKSRKMERENKPIRERRNAKMGEHGKKWEEIRRNWKKPRRNGKKQEETGRNGKKREETGNKSFKIPPKVLKKSPESSQKVLRNFSERHQRPSESPQKVPRKFS